MNAHGAGELGVRTAISVVIPAWREAAIIEASVRGAAAIGDEVIVADAHSPDATAELAARAGARVVQAERGRGAQLHAGAGAADGDVLLFLHADARLGPGAREALLCALQDPRVVGGNFRVAFVPARGAARLFTTLYGLRRRLTGIYYGDSAIFVRRAAYRRLGGFAPIPLMEDYDFVRRMRRAGRTVYLRGVTVEASARRFAAAPARTMLLWVAIHVLYNLGVQPDTLARRYSDLR
jgi:rSAM/selenodomain-associated transferase 2